MLKAEVESRLIEGVKELHEQFDPVSTCKGLSYAAGQLRLYGSEIDDDTELRCMVNNLNSIIEAMYSLSRFNELVLEYERNMKGRISC